jgi:hypothetical protein
VFILGVYPSALHIAWTPPPPFHPIKAITVDNEPEPFWAGWDQEDRIESWKKAVKYDSCAWGKVSSPSSLNGSAGRWVEEQVLIPLHIRREEAWITDCLDTYKCSRDLAARLDDTYGPFVEKMGGAGRELRPAILSLYPSEKEAIDQALRLHRSRLLGELEAANPDLVITLGNVALAIIRNFLPFVSGADIQRLSSDVRNYGCRAMLRLGRREIELLPLAHPAAPFEYQAAHAAWLEKF